VRPSRRRIAGARCATDCWSTASRRAARRSALSARRWRGCSGRCSTTAKRILSATRPASVCANFRSTRSIRDRRRRRESPAPAATGAWNFAPRFSPAARSRRPRADTISSSFHPMRAPRGGWSLSCAPKVCSRGRRHAKGARSCTSRTSIKSHRCWRRSALPRPCSRSRICARSRKPRIASTGWSTPRRPTWIAQRRRCRAT